LLYRRLQKRGQKENSAGADAWQPVPPGKGIKANLMQSNIIANAFETI
jgi:hypothetical protein